MSSMRDHEDAESIRTLLQVDTRKILTGEWPLLSEDQEPIPVDRIFSKTLVGQLCEMADRPWPEARRGKPISEQWLAKQLANFRIHPKTLRIGAERAKGYEADHFSNAFARYLLPEGDSSCDSVTYEGKQVFRPVTKTENVTAQKMACTEGNVTCHASKLAERSLMSLALHAYDDHDHHRSPSKDARVWPEARV